MKVILTGASDGLGLEIAKQLINNNVSVIGLSRTKPPFDGILHIPTDLTDYQSVMTTCDIIKEIYCDFDCIINCAGVLFLSSSNNIDYADIDRLFKINICSSMFLVSQLMDLIKFNGADIINVGSTHGIVPDKDRLVYNTTKWAVNGFTKNLQLELKDTPSRVIGFNPGGLQSNLFEKATGQKVDYSKYMSKEKLANLLIQILNLPKDMEVSNITISNKKEYHI